MASQAEQLPRSDCPNLGLTTLTENERVQVWRMNGKAWAGPLSIDEYVEREQHTGQEGLARDGGMTYWGLCDLNGQPNQRAILASCETLAKRAIVKHPGQELQDVMVYGIASVFCDASLRGRGYASSMIKLLSTRLTTWNQPEGVQTIFSVLFSDIGKEFYARHGWIPYRSDHISLGNVIASESPTVQLLAIEDVQELCEKDEIMLKERIQKTTSSHIIVSLVPDFRTMQWHFARENYIAKRIQGGHQPHVKGASVKLLSGRQAWCLWSRFFEARSCDNALIVLRIVIEDENTDDFPSVSQTGEAPFKREDHIQAVVNLLHAAQNEAAQWNIYHVKVWNPSALVLSAAQQLDPGCRIVSRENDSIACLKWHSDNTNPHIEWIVSEKFEWC